MSKRFVTPMAEEILRHLVASGMDPNARIVPPSTSLHGGCSDPGHCGQHSGRTWRGEEMVSIETRVSATKLHKIKLALA